MKPFECSENGVDRLGLFRIGKYPVFRRNVLRPVVILLEALRDCRHIPTGSEYAALVDTHIPPVCLIIEVVLNVLRYVDSPKLVGVKTAQPFIIGNIRVKAVKVKVLRQFIKSFTLLVWFPKTRAASKVSSPPLSRTSSRAWPSSFSSSMFSHS